MCASFLFRRSIVIGGWTDRQMKVLKPDELKISYLKGIFLGTSLAQWVSSRPKKNPFLNPVNLRSWLLLLLNDIKLCAKILFEFFILKNCSYLLWFMQKRIRDIQNNLPHVGVTQQSTVFFTSTSPSVHFTGFWVGHVTFLQTTLKVFLLQTHSWQPIFQVSPSYMGDEKELFTQHQQIHCE